MWSILVVLIFLSVIVLLLDTSTDLGFYKRIHTFIEGERLRDSIYVDVYTETNDITTGRDNRLAVVQPFNWYILNSRGNIYIHSTFGSGSNSCAKNSDAFLKLNNPLTGRPIHNIKQVCLPMTIASMVLHFSNKVKTRIYVDVGQERLNVLDVINKLLLEGAITNSLM